MATNIKMDEALKPPMIGSLRTGTETLDSTVRTDGRGPRLDRLNVDLPRRWREAKQIDRFYVNAVDSER
jgi:hypothetical protein